MADVTKLNWVGKDFQTGKGSSDVRIVIHKHGEDKLAGVFTFYDGCYKKFSNNGFAQAAIYKNRVFFREAAAVDGIKLSSSKNNTSDIRYLKFYNDDFTAELIAFEGTYELKYDEFYELYYIEKV